MQCSRLSWQSCQSWSEFWEIQILICKKMCKKLLVLTKSCRSQTDGPALVSNTGLMSFSTKKGHNWPPPPPKKKKKKKKKKRKRIRLYIIGGDFKSVYNGSNTWLNLQTEIVYHQEEEQFMIKNSTITLPTTWYKRDLKCSISFDLRTTLV